MPKVNGKEFPYTKEGKEKAAEYAAKDNPYIGSTSQGSKRNPKN